MEYNTPAIRAAARKLDSIADQLRTIRSSNVSRVSSGAKPLKGDTANALQDRLESLASDVAALQKGVGQCAAELYEFARRLDIADAKAKALVSGK